MGKGASSPFSRRVFPRESQIRDAQVLEILKSSKLEKYIPLFAEEEITLEAFLLLENDDLMQMGLPTGPRKILLAKIAEFKATHHKPVQEGEPAAELIIIPLEPISGQVVPIQEVEHHHHVASLPPSSTSSVVVVAAQTPSSIVSTPSLSTATFSNLTATPTAVDDPASVRARYLQTFKTYKAANQQVSWRRQPPSASQRSWETNSPLTTTTATPTTASTKTTPPPPSYSTKITTTNTTTTLTPTSSVSTKVSKLPTSASVKKIMANPKMHPDGPKSASMPDLSQQQHQSQAATLACVCGGFATSARPFCGKCGNIVRPSGGSGGSSGDGDSTRNRRETISYRL